MRRMVRISSLLAALLLISGEVLAAGLGRMSVSSALGQPLRAEIELLSVKPDELSAVEAKLASPEAYQQAHIAHTGTLSDLRLSVDRRADGQPVVRVTSTAPVDDPFVDILVELNWSSGRILREYTILLDPSPAAAQKTEAAPTVAPTVAPAASSAAALAKPALAPAAAKSAPAAKEAAPTKTYGPVKAGETLRGIAGKLQPADVSLDMMMASLYHANPGAFANKNMNLLKKGQVLSVPSRHEVMLAYSPHQAQQLIREQNVAWHDIQNRIAEQAGRTAVAPAKEPSAESGKIVPAKPQAKAPAAPSGKDVLMLSKGEPAKTAGDAGKRVHDLEEEVVAKNKALEEAQSRVSQLEKTVQDLQHLMALKTQEGAKKPEAAAAAPAPTPTAPEPKPAIKPVVKPPVAPPPPAEEPGFFSALLASPLYLAGGLAALVLMGLLWIYMVSSRRRKGLSSFEQSIMTGGDQFKTSIFKTSAGAPTQGSGVTQSGAMTDFSRLGLGSIDTHEVDPIAEAEVYMAYGRDAQAEEILKEALTKEPQRHEIVLKLLEIYAARQDKGNFETLASELYANLSDPASSEWQKAAELGRSIDPDNPLYRVFSEEPTMPEAPAPKVPVVDEGQALDFQPTEPAVEAEPLVEHAVEPENEALEFDLGGHEESAPAVEKLEPHAMSAVEDLSLDFEPEEIAEMPTFEMGDLETHAETPNEFPSFGQPAAADLHEVEAISIPEPVVETKEAVAPEQLDEISDFELPGEEPIELTPVAESIELPGAGEGEAHAEEAGLELPELDFSGIDLELAEPEALAEAAAVAAPTELEAPVEVDADLLEEVNTKLDLARAYLEMGDKEGAREILSEVLKEGNADQQQQADTLMTEIG